MMLVVLPLMKKLQDMMQKNNYIKLKLTNFVKKDDFSRAEISLCTCDKSPYRHTHDQKAINKKPAILVIK